MRNIFLLIFLFYSFFCYSQDTSNLVPNSKFEEYYSCTDSTTYIDPHLKSWFSANLATPDFFIECSVISFGDVPQNMIGFQYPKSGIAYVGLILNSTPNREYISIRLKEELLENRLYCFELYYSLANESLISIQSIQALFSPDSISQNDNNIINRTAQLTNVNPIISDTIIWELFSGKFYSAGNEKFLTIGNFKPDSTSGIEFNSWGTWGGAYYYIDDVRLYDCTEPDTNVYETSLYPNPNNGIFTVNYNLGENRTVGNFRIYDAIGKLVYDERLKQNNGRLDLNLFLSNGVYFWEIRDDENILHNDKLVISR